MKQTPNSPSAETMKPKVCRRVCAGLHLTLIWGEYTAEAHSRAEGFRSILGFHHPGTVLEGF